MSGVMVCAWVFLCMKRPEWAESGLFLGAYLTFDCFRASVSFSQILMNWATSLCVKYVFLRISNNDVATFWTVASLVPLLSS